MKLKQILITTLLALTSMVICSQSANAVTAKEGDLFLGIRASGGTGVNNSYVIDLGSVSAFRDATNSFTLSGLGDIGVDLSNVFGSDWYSRTDLYWGLVSYTGATVLNGDPAKTLYASVAVPTNGSDINLWTSRSSTQQGTTGSKIVNLRLGFNSAALPSTNSSVAVTENNGDANAYNSSSCLTSGASFGAWNPTIEGAMTDSLALVRIPVGTVGTLGMNEGMFSIDQNANITFQAVPEPSTYAMLALGVVAFIGMARRRQSIQA